MNEEEFVVYFPYWILLENTKSYQEMKRKSENEYLYIKENESSFQKKFYKLSGEDIEIPMYELANRIGRREEEMDHPNLLMKTSTIHGEVVISTDENILNMPVGDYIYDSSFFNIDITNMKEIYKNNTKLKYEDCREIRIEFLSTDNPVIIDGKRNKYNEVIMKGNK